MIDPPRRLPKYRIMAQEGGFYVVEVELVGTTDWHEIAAFRDLAAASQWLGVVISGGIYADSDGRTIPNPHRTVN